MSLSVQHLQLIISCIGWHPLGQERFESEEQRAKLFNDVLDHYKIQCEVTKIEFIEPSIDVVIALCLQHRDHLRYIDQANKLGMRAWEVMVEYEGYHI